MEVKFSAAGLPTMHVGVRLPFEGELLENVLLAAAPVQYWEELTKAVVVPQVGQSGEIAPVAAATDSVVPTMIDTTTL